MLDLRRLRLLRELHARGTMHGAAKAPGYTPSAISQQLAVLEREAGAKLLERTGRNVRLTDAGQALVDRREVPGADHDVGIAAALDEVGGTVEVPVEVAEGQDPHPAAPLPLPLAGSPPSISSSRTVSRPTSSSSISSRLNLQIRKRTRRGLDADGVFAPEKRSDSLYSARCRFFSGTDGTPG